MGCGGVVGVVELDFDSAFGQKRKDKILIFGSRSVS